MSHAHIISSRSDSDPSSGFLLALHILMWTTFALGVLGVVWAFVVA